MKRSINCQSDGPDAGDADPLVKRIKAKVHNSDGLVGNTDESSAQVQAKTTAPTADDCLKPFIVCPICNSKFNSTLHLPIMIPFTCNKVICWDCSTQLTVPSFECPMCNNVHNIPAQGYIVVEAVLAIAESFGKLSCHGEQRFVKIEDKLVEIEAVLAKIAEERFLKVIKQEELSATQHSRLANGHDSGALKDISNVPSGQDKRKELLKKLKEACVEVLQAYESSKEEMDTESQGEICSLADKFIQLKQSLSEKETPSNEANQRDKAPSKSIQINQAALDKENAAPVKTASPKKARQPKCPDDLPTKDTLSSKHCLPFLEPLINLAAPLEDKSVIKKSIFVLKPNRFVLVKKSPREENEANVYLVDEKFEEVDKFRIDAKIESIKAYYSNGQFVYQVSGDNKWNYLALASPDKFCFFRTFNQQKFNKSLQFAAGNELFFSDKKDTDFISVMDLVTKKMKKFGQFSQPDGPFYFESRTFEIVYVNSENLYAQLTQEGKSVLKIFCRSNGKCSGLVPISDDCDQILVVDKCFHIILFTKSSKLIEIYRHDGAFLAKFSSDTILKRTSRLSTTIDGQLALISNVNKSIQLFDIDAFLAKRNSAN